MKKPISTVALTLVLLLLIPLAALAAESSSLTMEKGTSTVLYNSVHSDDGYKTWTTSNASIVAISPQGNSCGVRAVGLGTCTVTVSVRYTVWVTAWIPNPVGGGGYWGVKPETRIDTYNHVITVLEPGKADVVTEVKFTGPFAAKINPSLCIGDAFFGPFQMRISTGSGTSWSYDLSRLSFTSSNPAVAAVGKNGVIHAVGKGKAVIKAATADGISDSYTVTVGDFTGYTAISTPQQLNAIRNNPTGKYYLARNIVFQKADFAPGGAFYNNGAGWVPIPNFKGVLNGNHYAIVNLQVNATGRAGLFANLLDATVSNLEMKNCTIRGSGDTGAIAGLVDNDYANQRNLIYNCKATGGTVSGTNTGGIAGNVEGSAVSLCQNSASVTGTNQVGGIAGRSFSTPIWFAKNSGTITGKNAYAVGGITGASGLGAHILSCSNEGAVKGIYDSNSGASYGSFYLGGIVGDMGAAEMRYCANKGNVSVQSTNTNKSFVYVAGGIAGRFSNNNQASNCHSMGSIQQTCTTGETLMGGLVGVIWSNQEAGSRVQLLACYSTGNLKSNLTNVRLGGVLGGTTGRGGNVVTLVKDCYYINSAYSAAGKMNVGRLENVLALSATQFKSKASFVGFDFSRVWTMGASAPQLRRGNFQPTYYACTVAYDTAGGSKVAGVTVAYNVLLTAPAVPTRTGSAFAGWYKDAACTKPWNFKTDRVMFSTTLYAKWTLAAPGAPKAASTGYNNVKVTWSAVAGAGGYQVWRSKTPSGGYTLAATTASTSHTNTGLATGTMYYYKIRAYRTVSGVRQYSAYTAAVSAKPVPAAVSGAKAVSVGYSSVKVTWSAVAGAGGYQVWRSTTASGGYKLVATVAGTASTSSGLSTGTLYYFKIRAYRTANGVRHYGPFKAAVSAKPVPATVTGAKAARASSSSIKLTWNAVLGANKYEVYRATSSAGAYTKLAEVSAATCTNTRLTAGKTYYYKVRAYRVVGSARVYGNFSAVVSAKP